MTNYTPILKLVMPFFDQTPWDTDLNNDLIIIDAAIGRFFGVANLVGIWKNNTAYVSGQSVVDSTDSSMWTCQFSHTSAVTGTFSADRTARPGYWSIIVSTAQDYATQAQNAAVSANTAATNAANSATAAANSAAIVAGALPLTGGTLTGPLVLAADPTAALGAATKQYVDARVGGTGFLPLSGGTLTGPLTLSGAPTVPLHAATKAYVDGFLPLTGGTLTGNVTSSAQISANTFVSTSTITAGTQYALTGSGYVVNTDATNTYIFMGNNYRWQINKSSNAVSWVRGSDGAGLHSIDNGGNGVFAGQLTLGLPGLIVGTGYRFVQDANYSYIFMDTNNWNWLYTRADGSLTYRNASSANLFRIDPNGNITTNGSGNFQSVQPHSTLDPAFSIYISSTNRVIQFASGWNISWEASAGVLTYFTGGAAHVQVRVSDNYFQNYKGPIAGNGAYNNTCDATVKHDILPITYGMDQVRAITPFSFIRNERDRTELGFVAQDIEDHVPEAVTMMPDDLRSVAGEMLMAVLWNAVKQIDGRLTAGGL